MKRFKTRLDKNALTIFDRTNGAKLRFAVGKYTKATKPELIDIKLTELCSFGAKYANKENDAFLVCKNCYMASDLSGEHASLENVAKVIHEMKKVGVFEAACGGGSVEEIPYFVEILKMFREADIIPNFTTKNPKAVAELWPQIKDLIGGFAYSAETINQIKAAKKMFDEAGIPGDVPVLHYVLGLRSKNHFMSYMRTANEVGYRVTLLGYKTIGRGGDYIPVDYEWWLEAIDELIKEGTCPSFSIDTPIASRFSQQLLECGIPQTNFHCEEGKTSLYIDAVRMKFGASSFEKNEDLIPFDKNWRKIYCKKSFAKSGWHQDNEGIK